MNSSDRSVIRTTLLVLGTVIGAFVVIWLIALLLHVAA